MIIKAIANENVTVRLSTLFLSSYYKSTDLIIKRKFFKDLKYFNTSACAG